MRLFKGFVLAVVGLLIMITIISLLIPSTVTTVRSVMINATPADVSKQVFDMQNWKRWHPMFISDSLSIKISQPSYGVNSYALWNSNAKENKILVTEVSANLLRTQHQRTGENSIMNIITIVPIQDSTGIQVEWRTFMKLKWYPWEKFAGIFADEISGPGYEAALNNLKNLCENR